MFSNNNLFTVLQFEGSNLQGFHSLSLQELNYSNNFTNSRNLIIEIDLKMIFRNSKDNL